MSGIGKRPYDIRAMYDVRDIFAASGTPLFVKQLDKVTEIPKDLQVRQLPAFTLD